MKRLFVFSFVALATLCDHAKHKDCGSANADP